MLLRAFLEINISQPILDSMNYYLFRCLDYCNGKIVVLK